MKPMQPNIMLRRRREREQRERGIEEKRDKKDRKNKEKGRWKNGNERCPTHYIR
jgi:hypothetical protein